MASSRIAQGRQWSITTQSVSFPVKLAIMGMVLRPDNAKKTELGVAKILFALVKFNLNIAQTKLRKFLR